MTRSSFQTLKSQIPKSSLHIENACEVSLHVVKSSMWNVVRILLEFESDENENDERVIETSFEIIIAEFYS